MNKQMQTISFNPPIYLCSEKLSIAIISFEATNSVFNITDENKKFSVNIPGRWRTPNFLLDGIVYKLKN